MKDHREMREPLGDVHPNAAGLDIGSREIWACVPPDRDANWVRPFGTFAPGLDLLIDGRCFQMDPSAAMGTILWRFRMASDRQMVFHLP